MPEANVETAPKPEAAPIKRKLLSKNFGLQEFRYRRWSVDLEESETLQDALDPSFYANIADKIVGTDPARPRGIGDIIEIRKPGTSLYAKTIIVAVGKGYVRVELVEKPYEPAEAELPPDAKLVTRWNPGKRCHEVIRSEDKQLLSSGHQTKADAVAWIDDHLKKLAA